jgi:hypothetical protein
MNLKKPDHISHSQIDTGKCLYKYYKTRLTGEVKKENAAMDEGAMVHKVIFDYTKQCIEKGIKDGDYELIDQLIDEHFDEVKLPEHVYIQARENLLGFAEKGFDFDNILAFEEKHTIDIGDGVMVELHIDRVNSYKSPNGSVIEIVDYKNHRNILTQEEVEQNLQLLIYKYIACMFLYPWAENVRVGIYHVRYNYTRWSKLKPVAELQTEFDSVRKFLVRQWQRLIETPEDKYEPQRGIACLDYGLCEVLQCGQCPLYTQEEVEKLKQSKEIDEQVQAYRKLNADVSQLKKEIMSYFKSNDMMEIDGKNVGYAPTESCKYKLGDLLDFGEKYGVSFNDLILGKTEVEKIIKKAFSVKKVDNLADVEKVDLEQCQEWQYSNTFKI